MDWTKAPRLFLPNDLQVGETVSLGKDHVHYLLTVMRKGDGDGVRVFNGRAGEFLAILRPTSKKAADLYIQDRFKEQPQISRAISLYFAPIKKDRLAVLIEKAVELGVTKLCPVMTDHTENRHIKLDKIRKQVIEAAEQCERLDIPEVCEVMLLGQMALEEKNYVAMERAGAPVFTDTYPDKDIALVVGPEGGWSDAERQWFEDQKDCIAPVSLGERILRAETACLFMLARLA